MNILRGMILSALLLFLFLPLISVADDSEGLEPLICAVIEDHACSPGEKCVSGTAESINLPQFLRINFGERIITGDAGDGKVRSTAINHMVRVSGKFILQGIQDDKAWSMVITTTTGKMTLAVADEGVGFAVFGICTVP